GITMDLHTGHVGVSSVPSFQIIDYELFAHWLGQSKVWFRHAMDCYYGYMTKPSLTDQIRDYARRQYIEAARRRRETVIQIVAGDVHKALGLSNRVPVV